MRSLIHVSCWVFFFCSAFETSLTMIAWKESQNMFRRIIFYNVCSAHSWRPTDDNDLSTPLINFSYLSHCCSSAAHFFAFFSVLFLRAVDVVRVVKHEIYAHIQCGNAERILQNTTQLNQDCGKKFAANYRGRIWENSWNVSRTWSSELCTIPVHFAHIENIK